MRNALGLLGLCALSCGSGSSPRRPAPPSPIYTGSAVIASPSFASMASRPVHAAAMRYAETRAADPPVSLTAPDGTGLRLVSLDARAVVEGPLALTELHLVFENPLDRRIEGRFAVALPDQAAISRLAMKLETGWQEAEMVERMAARRAYEDILHRRQDPALLEKDAGNRLTARVFPIEARGRKEILIAYSQELAGGEEPYRLPLSGWPEMERLEVAVRRGGEVSRLSKTRFAPDGDFAVSQVSAAAGLRSGRLAVARIAPTLAAQDERVADLLVLVDTSASRALGFAGHVERLGALVRELRERHGDAMRLRVACFDQGVESIYDGRAGGFGQAELDAILTRRPLGASNLAAALAWAGAEAHAARVILVTDGIPTAGPTDGEALRAAVTALAPDTARLDVVLSGGIRDQALMQSLARGTLAKDGVALDAALPAGELAARLSRETISGVTVAVEGAAWVWPETLDGVQPGDERLVFAELGTKETPSMTVALGGPIAQRHDVALATTGARPLLERAAAMARIRRLEAAGAAANKQAIVELSVAHRVLSEHTALLVLESEDDYARFGIDRNALSDILVVGEHGVEALHRQTPVLPVAMPDPEAQKTLNGGKSRDKNGGDALELAIDGDGFEEQSESINGKQDAFEDDDGVPDPAPRPAAEEAGVLRAISAPEPAAVAVEERPADNDRDAVLDVADVGEGRHALRFRHAAQAIEAEPAHGEVATVPAPPPGPDKPKPSNPYAGRFGDVMARLARGETEAALLDAIAWRAEDPADVMALVALGEALEKSGARTLAARAYGSIIDLYPSRADMRRFAGQRLERLGGDAAGLAADTYARAVEQRPDHPSSHRLYAWALYRAGRGAEALAAMDAALSREYPGGRFAGVDHIMKDDLALLAAAVVAATPSRRGDVDALLQKHGVARPRGASTRFVMTWETDANDVDLHVYDAQGSHAWFSNRTLPSGGELYADVTTGYGPEAFVIEGAAMAAPYHLQAHYYARGPMGYGMGTLDVIRHDGRGGLAFEHHPFVIMNDDAYVDLLRAPTSVLETR